LPIVVGDGIHLRGAGPSLTIVNDEAGGNTFTASPDTCPSTTLSDIDTAFDEACELGFEKAEGYQNIIIDDGSCAGGEAMDVGIIVVSAPDTED
jgi:hypothetical protein